MKIEFKNPEKVSQLVKLTGSKDKLAAAQASEAFAKLLSPVVGNYYQQANTTDMIFEDQVIDEGQDPTFPVEPFLGATEEDFAVWSQAQPGGLATNFIYRPWDEIKVTTVPLNSALSILKKYARENRVDILGKSIAFLMEVILLKTNRMAWNVALRSLAEAGHIIKNQAVKTGHVFSVATPDQLTLDDFNNLLTYFFRLNASHFQGTQTGRAGQPTDMILSPEMFAYLRSMSYQPINTLAGNRKAIAAGTDGGAAAVVALPEAQRAQIYRTGGIPEFFGIAVTQLNELGINQAYENIFETYIGNTTIPKVDGSGGSENFDPAADELIVVLDASKPLGIRVLERDSDSNSVFRLEGDDQFVKRSEKQGWYGEVRAGYAFLDTRGIAGLVV